MSDVWIERARWDDEAQREAMIGIRREVFIVEQRVPLDLEMDGMDPACRHLLAFDGEQHPIGTARMQASGHIGRICVVRAWRRRGVGARLVEAMVAEARAAGLEAVDLDSQVHAIGFYEKLGFEARGEAFMEAGIPHQNMVRAADAELPEP